MLCMQIYDTMKEHILTRMNSLNDLNIYGIKVIIYIVPVYVYLWLWPVHHIDWYLY